MIDYNENEKTYLLELFKRLSSIDKDWNGSEKSKKDLLRLVTADLYGYYDKDEIYKTIDDYDTNKNDFLLHRFRYKLIHRIQLLQEKPLYVVYKHTVRNGKVYFGITSSKDVETRWMNGFGYSNNPPFYDDINKYGWENIKHEILYSNLSCYEAQKIEKELISQYLSMGNEYGYNRDAGGRFSVGENFIPDWKYDIYYQFGAKRRPFKLLIHENEKLKLNRQLLKFESEIIRISKCIETGMPSLVIATNPSFKEKKIKEYIKNYKNMHPEKKNIFLFLYEKHEGDAFTYNCYTKTFSINMHVIDMKFYKNESVMDDLVHALSQLP